MTATTTVPTTPTTPTTPAPGTPEQATPAPGSAPNAPTATPGRRPGTGAGIEAARGADAASEDDGAPARRVLRVSAPPRPTGPAGYPETGTRPAPRTRRVRVGAPGVRRRPDDDEDLTARPLREAVPAPLPDPTAQCCTVVRAAVEVLRGERPAAQLARWVTPQVRDQLAERARIGLAHAPRRDEEHHRPVQVRRVRLVRLGDDAAEATVVLDDDGRVRAAAVRLEARRGAWRVAVLEVG
ncbi:Rv3235 family protein [Isoptericola sp. NPDC057391]|uniref:Rv3235 family protein n=1 Tax=Isoptericola sp. NPDC057391 TaxID=3346117 RepID=UPI0036343E50